MIVKDVTNAILGGQGMLECVCVQGFIVYRVSYRILSFGRGKLQSSVLT